MSDSKNNLNLIDPQESSRIMRSLGRGMSRREMLGVLVAGGMQLSVATGLVSVSGQALAQDTPPKRGGKIRVAGITASINDTMDPAKQSNQSDYIRGNMFYNGLTVLDSRLAPQPALAEEFSTKDAKVWTFKLRKGVTFHDGKPLMPADVIFSIMRHKDPATASKAKSLADQIEDVKESGPNEVQVVLSVANADLPVILGTFHFHIVKAGTTDFNKAIGTGPFKLKLFEPGVRSIGVRNENYWKPGKPYLDEIEYVGIGDETARVNALLSGDVDVIGQINPRSATRIQETAGFNVFKTQSGQYSDLIMRKDIGPGTNPDFILGMKLLLDREQMLKSIALGQAVIANDQPIDPTNRFHFAGLPPRKFDPEKAKFHLKKANIGSAKIPVVCSPAAQYSVDIATVLQQSAQRAGLNLEVKRMPADGYWANHWLNSPVGFGTVNPRPSADVLFTLFFQSNAAWNESRWKSDKFDQLLVAARAETDEAKRKNMYADMQVMVSEQAGIGIPMFLATLDGHTKKVKGLTPMPLGGLMGYSFAEYVWLEA